MLSEEISAAEAARMNLVARVVPDDELADRALEMAAKLSEGPTRAHAATKLLLSAWAAGGIAGADTQMIEMIANVLTTDDVAVGVESAARALDSGAERPPIVFRGE
ncbi:enoyl-CoA hydratase/isomerase family protein [Streptomyces sp. NPDC004393]